jgi:nitrate reductase gamma subunit
MTPERGPSAVSVSTRDVASALVSGIAAMSLVLAAIVFGSRGFKDFDTALVPYAAASVFSAFGIGYRYRMWIERPPTALYFRRGWQLFLAPRRLPGNLVRLLGLAWSNLLAQKFIERRSRLRWAAHALIFWGCTLASLVTFPLSFGWIRFETAAQNQDVYRAFVFGLPAGSFRLDSPLAPLVFNVLVIAAAMVLAGIALSLTRRAMDRGALAVQQLANDLFPLILLFAISATGILLTISARLLDGFRFGFLAELHAISVILTLIYLPFGKFFHIFQRPAQLSLDFYRRAGAEAGPTRCISCDAPFASSLHIADLKAVEAALGIDYRLAEAGHYQDVCPACRRKSLATAQGEMWRAARRPGPRHG